MAESGVGAASPRRKRAREDPAAPRRDRRPVDVHRRDGAAASRLRSIDEIIDRRNSAAFRRDVLFLHVGKAGGGTVRHRLFNSSYVFVRDVCHPHPCPDRIPASRAVLVPIRDPVDRFKSAFDWRARLLCRTEGETRAPGKYAYKNPDEICGRGPKKEREVIHDRYGRDATRLAEALCEPETFAEARRDVKTILHAKDDLRRWLGEDFGDRGAWGGVELNAVVQEPGFDFGAQVDGAIRWLARGSVRGDSGAASLLPPEFAPPRSGGGDGDSSWQEDVPDEWRHATGDAAHWKHPPLSDLGACCIARLHARDYGIITKLIPRACNGERADECRAALRSIVGRRARFLDESRSCLDVVGKADRGGAATSRETAWVAGEDPVLIVHVLAVMTVTTITAVAVLLAISKRPLCSFGLCCKARGDFLKR